MLSKCTFDVKYNIISMTLYIDQTKTHTDDINFNTNEMDVRV